MSELAWLLVALLALITAAPLVGLGGALVWATLVAFLAWPFYWVLLHFERTLGWRKDT